MHTLVLRVFQHYPCLPAAALLINLPAAAKNESDTRK